MAHFPFAAGVTDSYRSILYLEHMREHGADTVRSWTGPQAIEHYLSEDHEPGAGRLIQSLKSFLTSRSLKTTEFGGRRWTLEDLIARILRDLRERAEAQFGIPIRSATVGRPVYFVGSEKEEDNAFAEARLRSAYAAAGFEDISFVMEPVAAANYYQSTLDHDELILIGDFGGGTSDFSLLRVGPGTRGRSEADNLVGNAGLGLAGDAFDAKIVRRLVSPALGAGSEMRTMDKLLPVPGWVYHKLERWHHLSFLKARDTMNMLTSVKAQALEPEKIAALIHLVQEDEGYRLHQSVQKLKTELSGSETARFHFDDGVVHIERNVQRMAFDSWIKPDLEAIANTVDGLLHRSSVAASAVDRVFLTGGTSFVPAVRNIFESRFGEHRIKTGNEFTSVARGLALGSI